MGRREAPVSRVVRLESMLIGLAVLGFGVFLVASHGTVAGVNLLGLVGLNCGSGAAMNNTECFAFGGFGVGTVVCIFGLGMIANGLRAPSASKMGGFPALVGGSDSGAAYAAGMNPQMMAMMQQAAMAQRLGPAGMGMGAGPGPNLRYCSRCGRGNLADAQFCQQCGSPMGPPPIASASAAQGAPPTAYGGGAQSTPPPPGPPPGAL